MGLQDLLSNNAVYIERQWKYESLFWFSRTKAYQAYV